MSKSAGLRGSVLHFQDISSKLSSEELVKRLRVSVNQLSHFTTELLRFKLCCSQACSKFLAETEDLEDRLTSPLASLSAVLVEPFIHHHKTRDVRLLAACCMAELFRLFYPDPPYDEDQLKVSSLPSSSISFNNLVPFSRLLSSSVPSLLLPQFLIPYVFLSVPFPPPPPFRIVYVFLPLPPPPFQQSSLLSSYPPIPSLCLRWYSHCL